VAVGGAVPDQWLEVEWMADLLDVPEHATWPRLMTDAHPRAVGSYGWAAIERIESRRAADPMVPVKAKSLRWWQKLLIVRMYEHDEDGVLVWSRVVLSTSRQVGKSVGLREISLDRISQWETLGEQQLVLHIAKDLTIADEIQRPARNWASMMERSGALWHAVGANGKWAVECGGEMGRWLIRAQEAVYGYSASMAMVDEAWSIDPLHIEEGITPTMAEREQPVLMLISTAHRKATRLMVDARAEAIAEISKPDQTLLLEWSAADNEPHDVRQQRMASPHWDQRRRDFIASKVGKDGFAEQWLNIWPNLDVTLPTMADPEAWAALADPALMIPTGTAANRAVVIYPEPKQARWYVAVAGVLDEERVGVSLVADEISFRSALEHVIKQAALGGCTVLAPKILRGRLPRIAGVRQVIFIGDADLAAAVATVRPMVEAGTLRHDGSQLLAEQVIGAVVETYGEAMRISTTKSEGPTEGAKAATLAVWWAQRQDRPKVVVA
jgi:phage terminase large subunit-like protein